MMSENALEYNDLEESAIKTVFVGNLPFSVGWQDLKDLFKTIGTVARADVVSNHMGRSKGFGSVTFHTHEDALKAVSNLNGHELHDRKITVKLDQPNPAAQSYSNETHQQAPLDKSLYVGNLPYAIGWQDLKDLFRDAGNVVRADIPMDHQGRSRGFGIIVMSTHEEALAALKMFNGYEWNGRVIEVREDRSSNHSAANSVYRQQQNFQPQSTPSHVAPVGAGNAGRLLFVGNLSYNVQWQDLKDLFRQVGNVLRADIAQDTQGRSRGYGQILMSTESEALEAIEKLNGFEVQGRVIEVREDKFIGEGQTNAQVFVGNLPYTTPWQELKDLFRPHGLIPVHADILLENGSMRSKGCGIVKFATKEEADKAVELMNGTPVQGRNIIVRLDKFSV